MPKSNDKVIPASDAKPPRAKPPRKTAAQQREEAAQARQAAEAAFLAEKKSVWTHLWMTAMRLSLLKEDMPDFVDDNQWWFEDFSINAKEQTFILPGPGFLSESTLNMSNANYAKETLESIFGRIDEFEVEKERKRQEAIQWERDRQTALAKLNDRDLEVLRLTRK